MKSNIIDQVLHAYSLGLFPMADSAEAENFQWYEAVERGVLSIDHLHVPQRLRRTVLKHPFEIRVDTAFAAVIDACAASTPKRQRTWINRGIRGLFIALHEAGHAHSIECWLDGALVGGVYGLAMGAAFGGESMFSRTTNASKVALIHLAARLWAGGFTLFDAQLANDHTRQFGIEEITAAAYRRRLATALAQPAAFSRAPADPAAASDLVRAYLNHLRYHPAVAP